MKKSDKYNEFVEAVSEGKICIFETDTVVGLGCSIFVDNKLNKNFEKIYELKKRPKDKAFPWLISSVQMLEQWAINVPSYAEDLINLEWPGATTLIFEVNDKLPEGLGFKNNEGKNTVAFRIPDCEELINVIDFAGCPIACTSANVSGKASKSWLEKINDKLLEGADFVYTKKLHRGVETPPSKIISCLENEPKVLREIRSDNN